MKTIMTLAALALLTSTAAAQQLFDGPEGEKCGEVPLDTFIFSRIGILVEPHRQLRETLVIEYEDARINVSHDDRAYTCLISFPEEVHIEAIYLPTMHGE